MRQGFPYRINDLPYGRSEKGKPVIVNYFYMADDKEKQDQVLRILEVLCGQDLLQARMRQILQDLLEARKMWQANVSFQNAMEYLVLKEI